MNGEIAAANQRLASDSRGDSARQGAAIAFRSATSSPSVKPQPSAAATAALVSTANRHATLRRQMDSETGPEMGSVKDKIGRFTTTSLAVPTGAGVRGRPPQPSLSPAPEQIAARLAASRSPQRNPEPALAAPRIGAARSASKMPSRPAEARSDLRAPTPIRPTPTSRRPVDDRLQNDQSSFARDPDYDRSPSLPPRAASVRERAPSPPFSIASRASTPALSAPPVELKPKLPPRNTGPSASTARKSVTSGTLLRSATPSMASLSARSFTSSSSAVDEPAGMTEEALSNAIVASSLASSRASPSPATKIPPTPPRRRRARSILQIGQSPKGDLSRTPSPPKGMPQTLRGMPKADDTEAHQRHKRHLLHKHPHKHHEGDRKRWRREVTEKERKRYEGVWASNKGLHIPAGRDAGREGSERGPPATDMVLNLVVREIWSRSRLPTALLEQVWDLVDHQQIGLLTKEEFVVGMWLIDQQLKGHKLPNTVPDSVWDSVRYVTGIRLSTPRTY